MRVADHGAICWQCQIQEAEGRPGGLSINEIATTMAKALSRTQQACCLV